MNHLHTNRVLSSHNNPFRSTMIGQKTIEINSKTNLHSNSVKSNWRIIRYGTPTTSVVCSLIMMATYHRTATMVSQKRPIITPLTTHHRTLLFKTQILHQQSPFQNHLLLLQQALQPVTYQILRLRDPKAKAQKDMQNFGMEKGLGKDSASLKLLNTGSDVRIVHRTDPLRECLSTSSSLAPSILTF
jgi:hypothetical protein